MVPSILIVEDDLTFSTMLKTWLGKKLKCGKMYKIASIICLF